MAGEYDGFVFGAPVHFASAAASMIAFLDRAFFTDHCAGLGLFTLKPGAALVSARRAGTTAALDELNKFMTYAQMPVVSSWYWNMVHGQTRNRCTGMRKGFKLCGCWGKIWLGCSRALRQENKPASLCRNRKSESAPILSYKREVSDG